MYFLLLLYLLSYYVCNFVIANFSPCISMSPYCIGSFLLCTTYRDFYTVMSWNSIQIIVVLQLCCLCWHFTWPLLYELSSSCIQVFINCFTFVWMQCGQFLFLFIVKCSLCLSFSISSYYWRWYWWRRNNSPTMVFEREIWRNRKPRCSHVGVPLDFSWMRWRKFVNSFNDHLVNYYELSHSTEMFQ